MYDEDPSDEEIRKLYLQTRLNDIKFVLETLNARKVIMIGHGLGGTAAIEAARKWPGRIFGAVNMDGKLYDTRDCAGRPALMISAEGAEHSEWAAFKKVKQGWLKIVTFKGFKHWGFSDAGWLADITGVSREVKEEYTGSLDGEKQVQLSRKYIRDFVEYALGKGTGELVNGDCEEVEAIE